MSIGKLIKNYREANRLSMQEFADKTGLSKGYISMLEKGIHPQNGKPIVPSVETVSKIANAMGITIDELLERTNGSQKISLSKAGQGGGQPDYYLDPEVAAKAQEIYEDPELRILLDAKRDLSKEDLEAVINIVKALKAKDGHNF